MSIVTLTSRPALHHALTSPAASPDKTQTKMPNFELPEPPTPISPILAQDSDQLSDAGPSQISHASPRPPPPPPSYPRRHRSGVLMSRVRAKSSATSFKTGMIMTPSKSWGDLGGRGVNEEQESNLQADEDEPAGDTLIRRDGWKRVVSAGHRRAGEEVDDSLWDNSARFYHHIHSRPPSRSPSRSTSPSGSPVSPILPLPMSNDSSPVYIRRSLTLPPQNGPGPPNTNVKLSPNHVFLQQHLPPIFPHSGSSSEAAQHETPATHPMVILTPTTQQWKDLKEIRRLSGQDDDSEGSTEGSEAYEGRQSSSASEDGYPPPSSELMLRLDTGSSVASARSKPLIRKSTSADFLGKELIHTPDPGSPTIGDEENVSPIRPVFKPVIIAPSPVMPEDEQVPVAPETPTRSGPQAVSPTLAKQLEDEHPDHADDGTFGFGVRDLDLETPFDDSLGANDDPVRFASIGRRESLHVANKPEVRPDIPRTKTKRELERERLFKDLDEDIMSEGIESNDSWIGGVQQIGLGGGLGARPNPADAVMEGRNTVFFDNEFSKTTSLPIAAKPVQISLTHPRPFKPSPLHASPLTVTTGLPTPETPLAETSSTLGTPGRSRTPSRTSNLASLRDFARSLVSPRPQHMRGTSRPSTPSPPKSPRSPRQRDSTRFSLVAGRVVQPFAVPASTALPLDSLGSEKPSLQSFSPFRSPSPVTSKTAGGHVFPPSFNRFDSAISIAPSVGVPSECTTPSSETAGGVGGRGIEDYAILKEAGKGAYGLVMRAKVKGQRGEPVGEEVIIKYIVKARILADCWKKHKLLGPIPVEIHVMDQLRHLTYNAPKNPHPWDPHRARSEGAAATSATAPNTPDSVRSSSGSNRSSGLYSPTENLIAQEIRHSPERGHPNICKLLDFFEDRDFYYLVMPRFGTGVDLFDRVESKPNGLEPFEIRSTLGQLADGIKFLHLNGIVHRDVKDENVVLDGTGRCQLIDFGSAAHWRPGKRWDTFSGTLHYASPEILRGEMYGGKEQDVWALGVVCYVMLVGETPFPDLPDEVLEGLHEESRAEAALEARCGGGNGEQGKEADGGGSLADAADLVRRCLEMKITDRPSAEVVCHHRYLRGDGGWIGKKGWIDFGYN